MSSIINTIRWTLAFFLGVALLVIVTAAIWGTAVTTLATDSGNIRSWIKTTGVYDHVLEVAMAFVSNQSGEGSTYLTDLQTRLTTPGNELKQISDKILDPVTVENDVKVAITAMYKWFEGETSKPTFSISIVSDKATFADLIAVAFKEKLRGQPECAADFVEPADFDPITASCQPVGYDFSKVNKYVADHSKDPEFDQLYQKARFSSDLIEIDPQTTHNAQLIFSIMQLFPLIALGGVLVWSFIVWIFIPGKKRGLIIIGSLISIVSLIWGIASLVAAKSFPTVYDKLQITIQSTSPVLVPYVQRGIHAVYDDLSMRLAIVSFVSLLIGMLIVVIGLIWRSRSQRAMLMPSRPSMSNALSESHQTQASLPVPTY